MQLARQQGAGTVIATAGSQAKLAFLKELGADVAVDYTQPDWSEQVRLAAPGGVDVILEAVGGEALHTSIGLLAPFGRAVVYGAGRRRPDQRPGDEPVPAEDRVPASRCWRGARPIRRGPARTSPS